MSSVCVTSPELGELGAAAMRSRRRRRQQCWRVAPLLLRWCLQETTRTADQASELYALFFTRLNGHI
jgi:hypothetical protein